MALSFWTGLQELLHKHILVRNHVVGEEGFGSCKLQSLLLDVGEEGIGDEYGNGVEAHMRVMTDEEAARAEWVEVHDLVHVHVVERRYECLVQAQDVLLEHAGLLLGEALQVSAYVD